MFSLKKTWAMVALMLLVVSLFGQTNVMATIDSSIEDDTNLSTTDLLAEPNQVENADPILIESNAEFHDTADNRNWSGSGTTSDPYIISSIAINGTGMFLNAIDIRNTDVHFKLDNVVLSGEISTITGEKQGSGINLKSVQNAMISDVEITTYANAIDLNNVTELDITGSKLSGIDLGIAIYESSKIELSQNSISTEELNCIQTTTEASDLTITQNSLFSCSRGIDLSNTDNVLIKDNHIFETTNAGIGITDSDNIEVTNNNASYNGAYGIEIASLFGSDNIHVHDNIFNYNKLYGLTSSADATLIEKNEMIGNTNGIDLGSSYNLVQNNRIEGNSQYGIVTGGVGSDNRFLDNVITNNGLDGLFIAGDNVIIDTNIISDNEGAGLGTISLSNATITNNVAENNNKTGYFIGDTSASTISDNEANNNTLDGFSIVESADISLEDNVASNNGGYGYSVVDSGSIHFTDNEANDNGDGPIFSSGGIGDFEGNNFEHPDEDAGIVDQLPVRSSSLVILFGIVTIPIFRRIYQK